MELSDIDLKALIEKETNEKFNKQGCIKCPFHAEKTPSLRVKFFPDKNKEQYHCFGCEAHGDAIDFITNYKGLNFNEAREYLGFEVKKTEKELQEEKVKGYIDWELDHFRKGQQFLGIFRYVDKDNNIAYFKGKFKKEDGKKEHFYYHIENNKVIATRGRNEVPYNLYNVIQGIKDNKTIIFVEGEKDANNLNSLLRNENYVVTSIKGIKDEKDLEIIQEKGMNVFVIGDTGKAGEIYKWRIHQYFYRFAKVFKFINLPYLKELGDNKDVTDWLEYGYEKKDLLKAFKRSLDIKSKYELQQDWKGVYKTLLKEKDEETIETRKDLTDFKIIEATRINFIDEETEGIKIILKSTTDEKVEKVGQSTVFDDPKSFKNFLGSIDLAFKGKVDDLTDLKSWINKYFAIENDEIYAGVKFIEKDGQTIFVENNGSLLPGGRFTTRIKADKRNNADVIDKERINRDELKEVKKHLFKFSGPEKSISIIGTIINNLAVYQAKELKVKLHHLLIVGESGSGKSTILENVVATILNYPKKDIRSIGLISSFALIKSMSDGNYPILFDEFKPSALDKYKVLNLSETLRNSYDRATISKGNKSLKTKDFQLNRPLIVAGEESYPNQEKALIERSCIVYLSKREREEKNTTAMKWLIENEDILNKLGRSLIETILEISIEEYKQLREEAEKNIEGLENRVLNTAVNICTGIKILNKLFKANGLKELKDYEKFVIDNLNVEVLEGSKETSSVVERMLILYNEMIEDGRALEVDNVVVSRGDGIFIKTSEMINQINIHVNQVNADLIPLKLKDFKKQAKKSGYLIGMSDKAICINKKTIRFDTYDKELMQKLGLNLIAPPDFVEVEEENKLIPFPDKLQRK